MNPQWNVAIFASGGGSNARALMEWFADHPLIRIRLILTNRQHAGVLGFAREHGVPAVFLPSAAWQNPGELMPLLEKYRINAIAMAGFLMKIPDFLLSAYPDRILNIHPSLLPAYGGKGMYGHHVHEAVHRNGDAISGITIHLVNEHYDEGRILFQASTPLVSGMQPDEIAAAVLLLEHRHYAPVLEDFLLSL